MTEIYKQHDRFMGLKVMGTIFVCCFVALVLIILFPQPIIPEFMVVNLSQNNFNYSNLCASCRNEKVDSVCTWVYDGRNVTFNEVKLGETRNNISTLWCYNASIYDCKSIIDTQVKYVIPYCKI